MNFQFLGLDFAHYVIWFFAYSFLGWAMECIVIRKQLDRWENRGFVWLPFCTIYGFGCTIAVPMFAPIKDNIIALFVFGAIAATMLEYLTALVMLKLFERIWWDYHHMKYNYKGILCLESTLGWGCLAIFVIGFFNDILIRFISKVDMNVAIVVATVCFLMYIIDFGIHFYNAICSKVEDVEESYTYEEN